MKLGVMGGTFDPVHYGHLVAAEGVRHEHQLDEVLFVPAGRPPHKLSQKISEAKHRLSMTQLAVASNPFFSVSDIEARRAGPSYTYDTIREVSACYQPEEIFFITGTDAVLQILTWYRFADLLNLCYFVAVTRPGYDLANLMERLKTVPPKLAERIQAVEVPALAISSSDIRLRVRDGQPIKYLLPDSVEEYIHNNRLYIEKTL